MEDNIPKDEIYLDWNATTPLLPAALAAMQHAATYAFANPASVHEAGRRARAVLEGAREALARAVSVHPRDVVFTSGGTEANNLALHAVAGLVTSRLEHPSVVRLAERLHTEGTPVLWLPVSQTGVIDPDEVTKALRVMPKASWVAVMAVNHETGVLQPLREIAVAAHAMNSSLHVDAVQAFGKITPDVYAEADSFSIASHKLRGPKGIGALCWRTASPPRPLLLGGAQERGLRPGTQDAGLAAGFRCAIEHAAGGPERYATLAVLRDRLEAALGLYAVRNGEAARAPHVANLSFAGWSGAEFVAALDLEGLRVSSGSACSAGTLEPSPVIEAMLGKERAASAVRISLGESTDQADIEQSIQLMLRVLSRGN